MTSPALRGIGVGRGLLAAAALSGAAGLGIAPASAQAPSGAVVQPLPGGNEGAELRRHLADLGANPRSLTALIGAGRAAIRLGDGHAALGFFARAEEIAPSDARVKAGTASAFVLLEQPQAALRFFGEAARLGAPEVELARDRGLAYDLAGDPRRAQQDYALVLERGDDAETRRRLALSLAVSGDRESALRTLDPLLRRRDSASYRIRAFILALTGDASGAARAVDAVMPGQGAAMAPFLSRLATLGPGQKAMAVHFGRFPSDGRAVQSASADIGARPGAIAGGSPPVQAAPAVRRRPGGEAPAQSRPAAPRTAMPRPAPPRAAVSARPVQTAAAQPRRDVEIPPAMRQDPPAAAQQPAPPPAAEPARPAFSDIAELIRSLPTEPVDTAPAPPEPAPAPAPAPRAARPAAASSARPAGRAPGGARTPGPATRTAATGRAAAVREPAHPARHWVQIGTGQRAALTFTFNRIRQRAPDLFRNRAAHSAAMGPSTRLLIGPFASAAEARAFVNQLARQEIDAFLWASRAGEDVTRLPAR